MLNIAWQVLCFNSYGLLVRTALSTAYTVLLIQYGVLTWHLQQLKSQLICIKTRWLDWRRLLRLARNCDHQVLVTEHGAIAGDAAQYIFTRFIEGDFGGPSAICWWFWNGERWRPRRIPIHARVGISLHLCGYEFYLLRWTAIDRPSEA